MRKEISPRNLLYKSPTLDPPRTPYHENQVRSQARPMQLWKKLDGRHRQVAWPSVQGGKQHRACPVTTKSHERGLQVWSATPSDWGEKGSQGKGPQGKEPLWGVQVQWTGEESMSAMQIVKKMSSNLTQTDEREATFLARPKRHLGGGMGEQLIVEIRERLSPRDGQAKWVGAVK